MNISNCLLCRHFNRITPTANGAIVTCNYATATLDLDPNNEARYRVAPPALQLTIYGNQVECPAQSLSTTILDYYTQIDQPIEWLLVRYQNEMITLQILKQTPDIKPGFRHVRDKIHIMSDQYPSLNIMANGAIHINLWGTSMGMATRPVILSRMGVPTGLTMEYVYNRIVEGMTDLNKRLSEKTLPMYFIKEKEDKQNA